MTTITQNMDDIAGVDDNTSWTFYTQAIRESDSGDSIITTKKVRKYPVAGVLTVELDPGPAVVLAADGKTYPFTVPDADTTLWPLIQASVTIPPGTRHQELLDAVDAWLEVFANAWDTIPGKPAVVAAGATQAAARTAISAARITTFPVNDQGAVGDGTTNDRAALVAADTAALAAGMPVYFPVGTYRVATSLTIASPVVFAPGAVIKPSSGQTVTLTGDVAAPNSQIFDHSAGGLVVPKNVDFYRPCWWGPVGTANDSAAWTAMAASVVASVSTVTGVLIGQRVLAPAGINRMIGVTLSSCDIFTGLGEVVFVPPNGTTSGVVLTLGNYAKLHGGSFATTEAGQAVTCLYLQGYRALSDGVYVFNQAANSKAVQLGSTAQGSTSPILANARLISGQSTPASGSIALDIQSSDAQLSNVTAAQNDIGIKGQRGSGRWSNIHVWGNNTGISGDGFDTVQVSNLYLDSNRGWGMDVDKMDRAFWNGIYAWNNGAGIGSTGGIRLQQTSGGAQRSILRGVILDDNVGTGLKIVDTNDFEVDAVLDSSQVQGGGAVITTTGVDIGSGTARLALNLRGSGATTRLVNASTTTIITSPPSRAVATSNTVKNASASLSTFMSVATAPGQKYLIRGAIVVDGNQAADMQFRLQNSGATSPSGWFATNVSVDSSATSASAASVAVSFTNKDIAASGGSSVSCGLITANRFVVGFTGYLVAGTGASQTLDCQVAQDTSNASDTTFYAGSWMELVPV